MKQICLLLCFLCCGIFSVQYMYGGDDPGGGPPKKKIRSSRTTEEPIANLIVESNIVQVDFTGSAGQVEVTVYDETGMPVYNIDTNVSAGNQLIINSATWSGTYVIEITDTENDQLFFDVIDCD